MGKNLIIGAAIILFSLAIGMLGYHHFAQFTWMESYENAAMILSGMGPTKELTNDAARFFAGTYALFSGIVFLVSIAIIFAPVFHRFLHAFHLEEEKTSSH